MTFASQINSIFIQDRRRSMGMIDVTWTPSEKAMNIELPEEKTIDQVIKPTPKRKHPKRNRADCWVTS